MENPYAVLLDSSGIQKYVFGSNKLRENVGASYLVTNIYDNWLQQAVKDVFPDLTYDFNGWRKNADQISVNGLFDIGYIGGGNALLFLTKADDAHNFLKAWTKRLLLEAPGLTTVAACQEFDLSDFVNAQKSLIQALNQNKYSHVPQTTIPQHGITDECTHSGFSAEIWQHDAGTYLSSVAYAKLEAAEKSQQQWEQKFSTILSDKFCFTNDLEELGQSKGDDSHLAIVHIDGDNIGEKFEKTATLAELRQLSLSVSNAVETSFSKLLQRIVGQFSELQKALGFDSPGQLASYPKRDGKFVMPIRPLILGGDDITFVCDGKLGIYFAKIFIAELEKQTDLKLTACAGVAITKVKYPFYRGYKLAEELCGNAKKARRDSRDKGSERSWLDFHVAYGGFSDTLQEIRKSQYKAAQGDLLFRPYQVTSGIQEERSLATMIGLARVASNWVEDKKGFPRSKLKELQKVLTLGPEAGKNFVTEQRNRGRNLPAIHGKNDLFVGNRTPYFDMIELMEFYPWNLERS
jgi:hypothetical protein